ncbi:MAG: alpha/beta hydrolase family protein [Janthinobacterium lividum]
MKLLFCLLTALLVLLTANPPAGAQASAPSVTGDWSGSLQAGKSVLRLVFHFTPKADGTLTATVDSLDQGALGIPFSTARITGSAVHLDAAGIGAGFDGTLDASGKIITGHWLQSGNSLPLTLTKTDHAPAMDRPQEPKPPFPYAVQDVTFPGGAPGVTLAGTLTLPQGVGPFPVTVLISGSGPNDRDETVLGHKPFLLLADTLTRRGIAVLRYDKRGVGKSTGSYALATSADFALDAGAAVAYLKTQSAIDPKRIGLLGHSEGGLIAPLVASRRPDIAFVVLLAAPGLAGEKILLAQSALIGKAEGANTAQIAQDAALQKQLFAIAERETDPVVIQAKAQAAVLKEVAALSPADKAQISDPVSYAKMQSKPISTPWFRFFLAYDPLPALRKTHCPVLALDGSKDLLVPPAEDLALIEKASAAGGNTQVTVKELPNLNHLFQTCETGSPSEYAKITETMAPIVLTTISDWIAAQTGTK